MNYLLTRSANSKPNGHRAYKQRVCSHTVGPLTKSEQYRMNKDAHLVGNGLRGGRVQLPAAERQLLPPDFVGRAHGRGGGRRIDRSRRAAVP